MKVLLVTAGLLQLLNSGQYSAISGLTHPQVWWSHGQATRQQNLLFITPATQLSPSCFFCFWNHNFVTSSSVRTQGFYDSSAAFCGSCDSRVLKLAVWGSLCLQIAQRCGGAWAPVIKPYKNLLLLDATKQKFSVSAILMTKLKKKIWQQVINSPKGTLRWLLNGDNFSCIGRSVAPALRDWESELDWNVPILL